MNTFKNNSQLTNKQHEYVSEVAKLVDRPFPTHLSDEIILPISHSEDGFLLESDIENMQQFYIWFESLEGKIEEKELEKFSMFFDRTKIYEEICEQLLEEIDQSISSLDSLEEEYNLVSTKTGQLHEACEELLKQQQQLIKFATLIETKLGYFNDLDIITNQFNNPSLSVLDDSFMKSLNRLSDCTNFISENPNFLESKNYLMRFKQLQSRGLSMIKNFIVASLRSTFKGGVGEGGGGSGGGGGGNNNINFDNSQIYTKFKSIAPKIRPLCKEIESRISIREYQALLIDCHYCYTQQRKLLLSPFIVAHTRSLSLLPDLSTMIRTGCNYLIKLCQIEFDLFHLFFVTFSANLRSLLEEIGEEIYESLRPLFIRSQEIDVLSNAAHILKTEILEYSILNKGESVQSIQPIINRMLEDIQERLIFLSQRFILESISTFEPTFEQINYPAKLLSSSSSSSSSLSSSQENGIKTIYETWYPTLERTLLFLSKLFLSIDPKIFEGLAQETVSECSLSLIRASKIIEKRTGYLHSQLFLIRHLLILREQITPFEIEFCIVEKKLDFSSMREVFSDVFRGKFAWRSPKVVESQLDSKKDLEKAITESIEIFIKKIISPTTEPLSAFLSTALAFVNVQMNNNNNNSPLREQSFARPRLVKDIVSGVVSSFKPKLQMSVVQPIKLYFHNTPNNEERMLQYIRDFILKDFTALHNLIEKHYTEQDKAEINFNLHHVAELIDFKNWPHVGAAENVNNNNNNASNNIIAVEQSI